MTLQPGQDYTPDSRMDRTFFTKADPQPFRHPLLTHLQHSLYSQLDGNGPGKSPGISVPGLGPDYFYPATTPHRHSHSWVVGGGKSSKHHHHHHKSNSTALSALTLLAFLFFLNLLQNCLREQMETMNPTVMVMTAGAARGERLEKSSEQLPAAGDGEDNYGDETEPFFPEERIQTTKTATNISSSLMGANYYNYHDKRQADEGYEHDIFATTERSRFQRISLYQPATHDGATSSSAKSGVVFRTRG